MILSTCLHASVNECLPLFLRRSLGGYSFSFPASIPKLSQPWSDVKVREIIKELERDGWVQVRHRGSHRHYHHPTKLGQSPCPVRWETIFTENCSVAL